MADVLEYADILQEIRGAMNHGRLKMMAGNVIFKNNKTGRVDQYSAEDVRKAKWISRSRGFCLRLRLLNGAVHKYDGFKETEYDKLSSFIKKNYDTELQKVEPSVKGWNWGQADFDGNSLEFKVNGNLAFEVPLTNVSHCTTTKNEVTLEYHQNDDAPVSLMEMRFHIPTDKTTDVVDPDREDPVETVEEFYKKVLDKADIIQATGDAITIFSEVQCLTPRGRYDIKLYPSFLQLHGKTFDYKIPYTTILRLFLLPHRDGRQMFFVISLDPPIKQGQTRYHFLILLFNKEDETTLELGLSEEDIQEKYEGKLTKEMQGLEYEIISRLMKTLVNRKITVPGSFVGQSGSNSVGCSYKAATGFLYPLERGFIFVHKPPMHIRFDEVSSVNFARSSGSTRSFDFDIQTKQGTTFTFVGIDKDEYSRLYDFVKSKKIRLQNLGDGKKGASGDYDEMLDSDDGDDHDHYLERMKREGQSRVDEQDDDDDDESDDEDYQIPDDFSEVDEEWDTDAVSSGSSSSEYESGSDLDPEAEKERRERKEKRKAEKKAQKKAMTIKEPGTSSRKSKSDNPRKRKTKKAGKEKDPNKPKRPMTAYFLWFNESREELRKENPDFSMTELSKKAGELWRGMDSAAKKKYEEENLRLKGEYEEAMKEYKANLPDSPPKAKKAKTSSAAKSKSKVDKSPTKSHQGGSFKSKEYISDSSDDSNFSDGDSDDKPLKSKPKKEKKDDKPAKQASKSKKEIDSDASDASLPSDHDEDILSSPTPSEGSDDDSD